MKNKIHLFCHRGLYGCTDINQIFLKMPYAKGSGLGNLPPENSYQSVEDALAERYGVEVDVCMTKDHVLVITHTNHLTAHSESAGQRDYVSKKTFKEIRQMETGMGGKKAPFLSYEDFIRLLREHPGITVNVEIKGTIERKDALPPQTKPSIVEQLMRCTPPDVRDRIIWSSFSTEMIAELKKINPQAMVAQLFCPPQEDEPFIFKGRTDRYLQFTRENLARIHQGTPLEAVHVEISTLADDETLAFCRENNIHVRVWSLWERNPEKDADAYRRIQNVVNLRNKYETMQFDIMTDYAHSVDKVLQQIHLGMVQNQAM